MKNQTLITTLAVLAAVALTAIVALVVSTDALGSDAPIADTPRAIEINTGAEQVADQSAGVDEGAAADEIVEAVPIADETPVMDIEPPATTEDDAANEAPAADDENGAADEVPGDGDVDHTAEDEDDTNDTDDEDGNEDHAPEGEGPADEDEDEADTDDPADEDDADDDGEVEDELPVEPPCNGTILNGVCVSILCQLGFELNAAGDDCLFVGCPNGYTFVGNVCQELGIVLPCGEGFITQPDGGCFPDLGIVIPTFCGPGLKLVGGECVTVCPPNKFFANNGLCLPAVVNPDLQFPNLDFTLRG